MGDLPLVGVWLLVLVVGLAFVVGAHALGLPTTYSRDLLHVGASVWLLGWPWWVAPHAPVAIVLGAAILTALVPRLAPRVHALQHLEQALSDDDERWAGLSQYTLSFAIGTAAAMLYHLSLVAGGALLALSWGDGIGGALGRRFGRHSFRLRWAKTKSVEGTLAVGLATLAALMLWSGYLEVELSLPIALGAAGVAACAEAAAPRGSDNLLVPAATAIWLFAFTEVWT